MFYERIHCGWQRGWQCGLRSLVKLCEILQIVEFKFWHWILAWSKVIFVLLRRDFKLILWSRFVIGWRSRIRYLIGWEHHLGLYQFENPSKCQIIIGILAYNVSQRTIIFLSISCCGKIAWIWWEKIVMKILFRNFWIRNSPLGIRHFSVGSHKCKAIVHNRIT